MTGSCVTVRRVGCSLHSASERSVPMRSQEVRGRRRRNSGGVGTRPWFKAGPNGNRWGEFLEEVRAVPAAWFVALSKVKCLQARVGCLITMRVYTLCRTRPYIASTILTEPPIGVVKRVPLSIALRLALGTAYRSRNPKSSVCVRATFTLAVIRAI